MGHKKNTKIQILCLKLQIKGHLTTTEWERTSNKLKRFFYKNIDREIRKTTNKGDDFILSQEINLMHDQFLL